MTYEELITSIRRTLRVNQDDLLAVLDDYENLCREENLLDTEKYTMAGFSCKSSFKQNLAYNLYYDPASRNHHQSFHYIGLYDEKAIKAVGEIRAVVVCDLKDDKLWTTNGLLTDLPADDIDLIKKVINETPYYDLKTGMRFYLVDNFTKTHFAKTSFSSLRGKQYFNLREFTGFKTGASGEQVASLLDDKTWL